tara:strand:- start:3279 stop:3659 length:381 start_codon:yes stop_codon:yes gene_type:complete
MTDTTKERRTKFLDFIDEVIAEKAISVLKEHKLHNAVVMFEELLGVRKTAAAQSARIAELEAQNKRLKALMVSTADNALRVAADTGFAHADLHTRTPVRTAILSLITRNPTPQPKAAWGLGGDNDE